jgi:GAF domain-containing protein
MIANGHKLRVGEVGIVGRVAASGEPRITLDTGLDAVHFNNPLLPKTRSEIALPLKVENRTVGVLDIQSDQPQAFNDEDIAIMQVLTDQLAIAIERTRLLQQVQENLRELQQAYGRSTRESWKTLAESGLLNNSGYRFDNVRIQAIDTTPELGEEAMQTGQLIVQNENGDGRPSRQAQAAIPVKLRGQSIGVVTVKLKEGYNSNTINTIAQAVDRLAASLESARLFEEARSRADREQAIAQVTSAISSAGDFDTILRTTVEEIGKNLGDSEVSIQIISETGQA